MDSETPTVIADERQTSLLRDRSDRDQPPERRGEPPPDRDRPHREPPDRQQPDREQPDRAPANKPQDAEDTPSDEHNDKPQDRDKPPEKPASPWKRRLLIGAGLLVAIGLIVGGTLWWLEARHWASTDDAFLESHVTRLAPQVPGRIARLLVDDNQIVQAGQLLVEIDPRDLQMQLTSARARQASAAAQAVQSRAEVAVRAASASQADAQITVAEADLHNAEISFARFRNVDPRAVTQQQRDDADSATRSSRARLEAARQAAAAAHAQTESARATVLASEAALREAEAAVANAELQLSYTSIVAPVAGRITNRSVEVGNYVTPGIALFGLVEQEVWVVANYKESQLRDIRPGQSVELRIDAYPDLRLHGRVDSIQSGTGSRFSVLPAQNATGNYVKITQRVPVKIVLDQDRERKWLLSPGLSVVPSIRVRE